LNNGGKNNNVDSDEELIHLTTMQNDIETDKKIERDFDPGAKHQDMNKKVFIDKYGV
jgi:hypothetical protein